VTARARFALRCLLRRAIPPERMGEPLALDEALKLVAIWRGRKLTAPEPERTPA